jgi:hypothetical protein
VRFERTDSFRADYRRLSAAEKLLVRAAIAEFASACDEFRWRRIGSHAIFRTP